MEKLTAIIPTYNEEQHIEAAIASVAFADEIIVVDSHSTDRTVTLAQPLVTKVLFRDFDYYAAQKNWTIPQATHAWILLLDADERITPALQKEIEAVLKNPPQDDTTAYWIYRQNYFMGKRIKYSGWQNDKVIRLFKRDTCRYQDKLVHEEIETKGTVRFLKNRMEHYTYRSLDAHVKKLKKYASFQAQSYNEKTGPLTPYHFVLKPLWRFVHHYIIRLGFLDGVPGFMISYLRAYSLCIRYAKMWLIRKGRN